MATLVVLTVEAVLEIDDDDDGGGDGGGDL